MPTRGGTTYNLENQSPTDAEIAENEQTTNEQIQNGQGSSTNGESGLNFNNSESLTMASLEYAEAHRDIPEYSGKNEDTHRFITICDMYYDGTFSSADQEKFFKLLKIKLHGEAYDLIKYDMCKNYVELRKLIQCRFTVHKSYEVLHAEMLQLKQNHSESISEFGYRLTKALTDINDAAIEKVKATTEAAPFIKKLHELVAINIFKFNCLEPVRSGIRNVEVEDLRSCINSASAEELRCKSHGLINNRANSVRPPQSRFSNQNCQRCGKIGHPTQNCRTPLCTRCNKIGHLANTCYVRLNPMQQFSSPLKSPNIIKRETNVNTVTIGTDSKQKNKNKTKFKIKNKQEGEEPREPKNLEGVTSVTPSY